MKKNIFKTDFIELNSTAKTKLEALQELSKLGLKHQIVDDSEKLLKGYLKREKETSTGLEDGFAIPHARIKAVKKPAVFFIRYQTPIGDWETFDGSKVKAVISLMIPDQVEKSDDYITLLSSISQKLLDEKVRKTLKSSKSKPEILKALLTEEKVTEPKKPGEKSSTKQGYLIAITGCPAGVAHTYMAAKKIEDYASEKGWKVKVEKQGANGIEDKLTAEDVQQASALLVSCDINPVEMERFKEIPTIKTPVAEPMHDMDKIWNQILKVQDSSKSVGAPIEQETSKTEAKGFRAKFRFQAMNLKNAILTGISFVVPVIVAGTTIMALITIINQIAGVDNIKAHANWLNKISDVAGGSLSILLAPILAAYISYAMADKPGLFPGFLGGLACNAISLTKVTNGVEITAVAGLGFLGGLITGIICGYMMKLFKKYLVSKHFQGVLTWFVYPVLSSLIIVCLILFGIGHPIALLISVIFDGLNNLQTSHLSALVGILIGAMCCFDLGGPFNKVAWAFGFASYTQAFQVVDGSSVLTNPALLAPYTAFWAAGIGTGWTTSLVTKVFCRKFANKEEKEAGNISWLMSSLGITEGAIPFMLSDPFRVIPGFVVGGALSGGLSYALNLGSTITGGGFITAAGVTSTTGAFNTGIAILVFILVSLAGSIVSTALIVGLKFLSLNKKAEAKAKLIGLNILTFGFINLKKDKKAEPMKAEKKLAQKPKKKSGKKVKVKHEKK